MSELFEDDDTNLYGAPNKVAVIIARGGGEYIDWTDANKVIISISIIKNKTSAL